jgi:hypothetical protein
MKAGIFSFIIALPFLWFSVYALGRSDGEPAVVGAVLFLVFVINGVVQISSEKNKKALAVTKKPPEKPTWNTRHPDEVKHNEDMDYIRRGLCPHCSGRGAVVGCKNCRSGTLAMIDDHDDNVDVICVDCKEAGEDYENIDYIDCEWCNGTGRYQM